jgi:phosphatidate cytidylyltransferase
VEEADLPRFKSADHGERSRRELILRVGSAVVLAPLAVAAAYLGGWPFLAFWFLAAIGILWEWTRLVGGSAARSVLTAGTAALVAALVLLAMGEPAPAVAVMVGGAGFAATLTPDGQRLWSAGGILYAGVALAFPPIMRSDPQYGFQAIVFIFAVVWATDIAAYFSGRMIGGPKLALRLSPKKTWSGAAGGAIAAVIAGSLTAASCGLSNLVALAVISLFLSVAAQIGDLAESALKRAFGAKDASHIIPGHGGIMDRLDGFLAAILMAVILGISREGTWSAARGLLLW